MMSLAMTANAMRLVWLPMPAKYKLSARTNLIREKQMENQEQTRKSAQTPVISRLFMKLFKHYILRPIVLMLMWALIFSFIAGTCDFAKWSTTLRAIYIITLFLAFILTDAD